MVELDLDVTVVLPVYNEAGHLRTELDRICEALSGSGYTFEVIVVDDGSDDGSMDEIADAADGEVVRVIRFSQNRGSGSARRAGTAAARGRVTVWTDADLTYPNERIPELVKELDSGWDQVVGARSSEQGTAKALRVPAKWMIRHLAQYLVEQPIPDLNSGLRAFRTDVARQYLHLLPAGFSCVTTISMSFLTNGYSVRYIDIDYAQRAGTSKFHWWKDTKRYAIQVIRMVLSYDPLRIFLPMAATLGLLGGVKLAFDLVRYDFRPALNTMLLLFAVFQILMIGLLADLIVRMAKPADALPPAQR